MQVIDKKNYDAIFFMLNNCDIRHNNRRECDLSKYKKVIAEMCDEELEEWYDELYQMILLAYLLLDNTYRMEKVAELKERITGKEK